MPKLIDITGNKYGHLLVESRSFDQQYKKPHWNCTCDCGTECIIVGDHLRAGHTKSCGCAQRESARNRATHGNCSSGKVTSEYTTWNTMRERCNNPNTKAYPNYGGRGIKVCDRWSDFNNFINDMGEKPDPTLTLDRIDNDGNYEPSNCRWATRKTQALNSRKRKGSSSKYKGVSFETKTGKWKAQSWDGEKRKTLGRFNTEIEAANAFLYAGGRRWLI